MSERLPLLTSASTDSRSTLDREEIGRSTSAPAAKSASAPRDRGILIAKALAIFGVVANHLANRRFSPEDRDWIAIVGNVSMWAVPLFLLVSGYLHGKSRSRSQRDGLAFVFSRARRLLVPYLIVSLVYDVIYSFLLHAGYLAGTGDGSYQWYDFFLASLKLEDGIGEQLYFLPLLFVVSVGGFGLLALVRWSGRRVFLLAFALLSAALLRPQWFAALPGRMVWPWHEYAAGVALYVLGFILATRPWLHRDFFVVSSLLVLAAASTRQELAMQFLFPVALLCGLQVARLRCWPLEQVGEAAGTIFLYHTPFFMSPILAVIATRMPERFHVGAAYGVGVMTIVFFTIVHAGLRRSRLKWITY